MTRAPRWSGSVRLELPAPLGRWGTLTPAAHIYWRGETYYRAFNRDFDRQAAYRRTDVLLTWDSAGGLWERPGWEWSRNQKAPSRDGTELDSDPRSPAISHGR